MDFTAWITAGPDFMKADLFDVKQSSLHIHFLTAATITDIT